jgi:UDP-N-acetylglucosamine 2-epimerase (non-hydrolysing)
MLLVHVVGARPNFMKAAPVMSALEKCANFTQLLVHTGQHYDDNMSNIFFRDLCLQPPDLNLGVGSGSHSAQTAEIMLRIEPILAEHRPAMLLVYGDVNSTVAAALVAVKMGITVAHVEAGLRSFDRSMPEEINRVITDQISDILLTPSEDGDENLRREGVSADRIFRVGNVMIDTLLRLEHKAETRWTGLGHALGLHALRKDAYALVTLHRPSNVDEPDQLRRLMETLKEISLRLPVIFPVHPRTRERLRAVSVPVSGQQFSLIDPLGYLDFLALEKFAAIVITDSGGVQEETTALGIPCLTMRENTERPVTVTIGTNRLIGKGNESLKGHVEDILARRPTGRRPPLWDGHAGERIATVLASRLGAARL